MFTDGPRCGEKGDQAASIFIRRRRKVYEEEIGGYVKRIKM